MHDCASHDLDLQRWISQEDPVSVYAQGTCFDKAIDALGLGDWDNITISLKFPSGTLGLIDVSRHATYGYDQRIEVHGTKGMLQAENERITTVVYSNENGSTIDPTRHSFPQRYVVTYATELDHFVDVMEGKAKPALTREDAKKVSIIADAATESARTGLPVILKYD